MNSLSWGIYLAQVSGGAREAMIGIGALIFVAGIIQGVAMAMKKDYENTFRYHGKDEPVFKPAIAAGRRLFVSGVIIMSASVLIPSTVTVYAMMASQVGEKALTSQTGDKAINAINAWMDAQIERRQ